jgi:hypothetical protein
VQFLKWHCAGVENAIHQDALAARLGWSTRYLQEVVSEEARHNGHIGTGAQGVWYSVTVEDDRRARRSLVGRIRPIADRVRAIDVACPQAAQGALF